MAEKKNGKSQEFVAPLNTAVCALHRLCVKSETSRQSNAEWTAERQNHKHLANYNGRSWKKQGWKWYHWVTVCNWKRGWMNSAQKAQTTWTSTACVLSGGQNKEATVSDSMHSVYSWTYAIPLQIHFERQKGCCVQFCGGSGHPGANSPRSALSDSSIICTRVPKNAAWRKPSNKMEPSWLANEMWNTTVTYAPTKVWGRNA